ncbi:hypothetical protein GCM10008090_12650 [Arenicella chitinivorans]|uniref:Lipoprotein n=2 Tax=Arenicella chitinivorans TaxID=1329800 RepID=A0A918RMS3_9GAMM|nr:hypothetical protein GCM10008090_12650 [Arenicella chitinivorans]
MRLLTISLLTLMLVSCAASQVKNTCAVAEPLPLIYVNTADVARYWKPTKSRQVVHFPKRIEAALASGRLAGFLVSEQTILADGSVADVDVLGYYPDEAVLTMHLEYRNPISFKPVTCPVQPIRYRGPHFYGNGDKTYDTMKAIYDEYIRTLETMESDANSMSRP